MTTTKMTVNVPDPNDRDRNVPDPNDRDQNDRPMQGIVDGKVKWQVWRRFLYCLEGQEEGWAMLCQKTTNRQ